MEKVNNKPWQMCRCRVGNVLVSRENPADFVEYPQGIQADLARFFGEWFSDAPTLSVHTSGSTGEPKVWRVRKEQMMNSARITCEALGLRAGDRALLCMPLDYIAGKMVVVRALVAGLELVVREPSGHPLADIVEPLHFAAMVPLQVYDSLQIEEEEKRLAAVGNLIIGGGAIDRALEERLRAMPNRVYSTYGMTETLSHIALRRLNGPEASAFYHPFPSVRLALSEEQTLVIDAPLVCDELLHTNDVAELRADGSFRILGRRDNIVSSGGIKIQLEQVEEALRPLMPVRFALTSVPHPKFGEALVLLHEGDALPQEVVARMQALLPKYQQPKYIFAVDAIPLTGTGKISRAACRELARCSWSLEVFKKDSLR